MNVYWRAYGISKPMSSFIKFFESNISFMNELIQEFAHSLLDTKLHTILSTQVLKNSSEKCMCLT